jgi:Tol biopolymer transport system component
VLTLKDGTRPFSARWSPDGSRIAYERISETTDPDLPVTLTRAEIWVMARDGSSRQRVFRASSPLGAMSEVQWSPDGRYLSFSVLPEIETSATSVTYVAAADGTGVRTVQTANWNRPGVPSIAWQPLPVQAGMSHVSAPSGGTAP